MIGFKVFAWCKYNYDYNDMNYENGYAFLEIFWWKISLYQNKITLNIEVRFSPESYNGWCAPGFKNLKKNTPIKVECKIWRNQTVLLKGKLANDMDEYAYEGMIIWKITTNSIKDNITTYFDNEASRIRCNVYGNDTIVKIKLVDKRNIE